MPALPTHAEVSSELDPELVSIKETQRELGGLSRTTVNDLIRKGELVSGKIAGRRFVTRESIRALKARALREAA